MKEIFVMGRIWKETVPPKMLHDNFGIYKGTWMPQMDRCWYSEDGYSVMSRLIRTDWGKVEHVTIEYKANKDNHSMNGERDIPWHIKQEIKNELFGENRTAIEVFPNEKHLIDVMDIYHLWVFEKGFKLPFGIHPIEDKQCPIVNRGYRKDTQLIKNTQIMLDMWGYSQLPCT